MTSAFVAAEAILLAFSQKKEFYSVFVKSFIDLINRILFI